MTKSFVYRPSHGGLTHEGIWQEDFSDLIHDGQLNCCFGTVTIPPWQSLINLLLRDSEHFSSVYFVPFLHDMC